MGGNTSGRPLQACSICGGPMGYGDIGGDGSPCPLCGLPTCGQACYMAHDCPEEKPERQRVSGQKPRASWRRIKRDRHDVWHGVIRQGTKVLWECDHPHPTPDGWHSLFSRGPGIEGYRFSAFDCAEWARIEGKHRESDQPSATG